MLAEAVQNIPDPRDEELTDTQMAARVIDLTARFQAIKKAYKFQPGDMVEVLVLAALGHLARGADQVARRLDVRFGFR